MKEIAVIEAVGTSRISRDILPLHPHRGWRRSHFSRASPRKKPSILGKSFPLEKKP